MMFKKIPYVLTIFLVFTLADFIASESRDANTNNVDPWQPGYLDIHHINTGGGDAAFFIFPDGTPCSLMGGHEPTGV